MTVKIHIPSSDPPEAPVPRASSERPLPGPIALIAAGLAVAAMAGVLVVSVVSGGEVSESSVPAPFEPSDPAPAVATALEPWSEIVLPGDGEVLAMGTVVDTPVAVTRGPWETLIWELVDGTWQLGGSAGLAEVTSAVVMDQRILLVSDLEGRPTVWEWIDGSTRYLFQPTSGLIVGTWSVGGRLFVSVAPSAPEPEQTIRVGREDVLWIESLEGDFEKLMLVDIESVLTVAGDAGLITVGGRDTDGRAAVGFVQDDRVLADPVPGAPPLSAVTDLEFDATATIAHLSVANRRRGTHSEVRSSARGSLIVDHERDLVGIEVIDGVVVGVTRDGRVVRHRLDGEALPAPPEPAWSYGFVRGLAVLGDEPVAFGQSQAGSPMFVGPSAGDAEVMLPVGRWERYHSEKSDGFRLVRVGVPEFATRDGELFYRTWNGDRWHPIETEGELVVYGAPRIVELEWGFALIPAAGAELWSSPDGAVWDRVDGSDIVRIDEVATDGRVLVGVTHLGALGGPMTEVTVLNRDGELIRYSLGYHLTGLAWEAGVGFAGSVVPPGSGYVTSPDGLEWAPHLGPERFDWVVAFDGALYLGTGESVIAGDPPAETPGGEGWLSLLGETPAFQDGTGTMWIHTGDAWVDIGLGVLGGLPGRPDAVMVRGSRVFAMVDGSDGVAETYVLELD
jgi:hypothetical protein